ncbi:uncharacterized protein N0V89_002928 [Didymosphaeria variabile]|uniref:Uncharacterized protein n=1 Tax=Didymosphaeria variabile TaxID=1932322 RepID=A0A9W8XTF7_9PLEO|nr:uncharacterized protein N0V89_002928 [Didymosphaeria variabile]KAJ4358346.1 hypothetical protein N0V89_002928 [Didymosphaeria variabile]
MLLYGDEATAIERFANAPDPENRIPTEQEQTILGRPGRESRSPTTPGARNVVPHVILELSAVTLAPSQAAAVQKEADPVNKSVVPLTKLRSGGDLPPSWIGGTILARRPQSPEIVFIGRAIDTLRYEGVEEEWFQHLPAHFGNTLALDLSIKALVAACAYKRSTPNVTSGDCYQALALALNAVQANIKQSRGEANDDMLASTALLARFEGEVKRNYVPTRLHVEGLATILSARPATYPVTQLARDILDFHAGESAIMACIQDTSSPFENVARAYYTNDRLGCSDSDRAQLKSLSNEVFIRLPRLVRLVRSLRLQMPLQHKVLLSALKLSENLLELQDPQAEEMLLRNVKLHTSSDSYADSLSRQSLQFACYKDFEALANYWQSRLSLLRIKWRLHGLYNELGGVFQPSLGPIIDEMLRLAKNILMCSEYAATLLLNKHFRLFAHAMVIVWGVTMNVPEAFGHDQARNGRNILSSLLLQRVNRALKAKPAFTAEDINIAAEIFVGGPLSGRFAELFGL